MYAVMPHKYADSVFTSVSSVSSVVNLYSLHYLHVPVRSIDRIFFQFAMQSPAADAEFFSGIRAIAVTFFKRFQDQHFFVAVQIQRRR